MKRLIKAEDDLLKYKQEANRILKELFNNKNFLDIFFNSILLNCENDCFDLLKENAIQAFERNEDIFDYDTYKIKTWPIIRFMLKNTSSIAFELLKIIKNNPSSIYLGNIFSDFYQELFNKIKQISNKSNINIANFLEKFSIKQYELYLENHMKDIVKSYILFFANNLIEKFSDKLEKELNNFFFIEK